MKQVDETEKKYQVKLPKLSDEEAIKLIRANNPSFDDKICILGLFISRGYRDIWRRTALRIMDKDVVLGKAMLVGLIWGRGGSVDEESWLSAVDKRSCFYENEEEEVSEFDSDQVVRDLYDAELMYPEDVDINAFYIFYKIIQFGNPDEYYWQDAMERALDLCLSLSISEGKEHVVFLLGYIAFYAEEDSALQKKALDGVEQILQLEKGVLYEVEFCTFCYPAWTSFRQIAFEANPDSRLHDVAFKSFCKKMKDYVKVDFDLRMSCLVAGIGSQSDVLREEAAIHYIESFPVFAVGNIKSAFDGLSTISGIATYECEEQYPPMMPGFSLQYKTQIACKVLENGIKELSYLNLSLADEVYECFVGSREMLEFSPLIAPEGLGKVLEKVRVRRRDIRAKERVYGFFKEGIDLRATLKDRD